jgi:hypothetical protein
MKPNHDPIWEQAYEISGWNALLKRCAGNFPETDPAFKVTADRFWEVFDQLKADAVCRDDQ